MALIDSIIGAESGGNPNAKNPNSSAGGLGQFIDSTWLAMLKQERPDLVEGRSPQELLALKSDPALSRQMTEAYANQNGKILTGAGFEANPGSTYLAHFAGPQGAVKVLSADPATPVGAILGEAAVKANPFLKGMTAADLQAWAIRKMGGVPQPSAPQPSPASPATNPEALPTMFRQGGASQPVAQSTPLAQMAQSLPIGGGQAASPQQAVPEPMLAQMLAPQRRPPPDLTKLRAALEARFTPGLFLRG